MSDQRKGISFLLAVYPQFLKPDYGPLVPQAAIMAAAMTAGMQLAIYGGLALAAGYARRFLLGNGAATIWTGRVCGALLVTVSAFTLWEGPKG